MNLIGLNGFARSGKDTAGAYLTSNGSTRFAFGDTLKEQMETLDFRLNGTLSLRGLIDQLGGSWGEAQAHRVYGAEVRRCLRAYSALIQDAFEDRRPNEALIEDLIELDPMLDGDITVAGLLAQPGMDWEKAKDHRFHGDEVRRLLQVYATELCRVNYGDDVWVRQVQKKIAESGAQDVVLTDVRFNSEASWVVASGGSVIEITRPGVGPVNGHSSEMGIDRAFVSATLSNDGTIAELFDRLETILKNLSPAANLAA